jgi:hypothetical protein
MTREQALAHINANPARYLRLQPDGSGKGYICPVCGSGSGQHGTGITVQPRTQPPHLTCWAGCFTSKTAVDIIALKQGRDASRMSKSDFDAVFQECGLEVGSMNSFYGQNKPHTAIAAKGVDKSVTQAERPVHGLLNANERHSDADYTDYINECAARIEQTDYHRGISVEPLKRFRVGYDPAWVNPTAAAQGINIRIQIDNVYWCGQSKGRIKFRGWERLPDTFDRKHFRMHHIWMHQQCTSSTSPHACWNCGGMRG